MKILILTSGGDAPGMNKFIATLAREFENEVYGVKAGFQGLINGDIKSIDKYNPFAVEDKAGSCIFCSRCPEFKTDKGFKKGLKNALKYDLTIVLGGNGSLKGAKQLTQNGVRTVFVPATIDNDVNESEYSIGFYTAVQACCDYYKNTMPSMQAFKRCAFFVVMGRHHDAIANACGKIVKADMIIGKKVDYPAVLKVAKSNFQKDKATGIIIRENIVAEEDLLSNLHEQAPYIDFKVSTVGHIQRGTKPTEAELKRVEKMAKLCINEIKNSNKSFACLVKHGDVVIENF